MRRKQSDGYLFLTPLDLIRIKMRNDVRQVVEFRVNLTEALRGKNAMIFVAHAIIDPSTSTHEPLLQQEFFVEK